MKFRKSRCPACGRVEVPGRSECPFCNASYASSASRAPESSAKPNARRTSPRLVCVEGPQRGQEFIVDKHNVSIGRGPGNDIPVEGLLVSRHHAEIIIQDDQYVLSDHNSANGTYVNGRRVDQQVLQFGDQIRLGPSVFAWLEPGTPLPSPGRFADAAPFQADAPGRAFSIGSTLGGFQILENIADSGMAFVFKGVSLKDHTPVAIKVLRQTDPYVQKKFRSEAEIGMALHHPHIARLVDFGETDGTFYIVMEYVDNGSLRDRLVPGQPFPVNRIVPIIGQVCDALHYAHNHPLQVIHRDIKPENIMFSSSAGVKVIDFGIARVASQMTRTSDGMIVGTPYYMSCEQAKGLAADVRSDIYALGVVLYEMLTGQVPFDGAPLEVVHKHITDEPIPPRQINHAISPKMESIVLRALAKDPQQRFHTAADMSAALGYTIPADATFAPIPEESAGSFSKEPAQQSGVIRANLVVFEGVGFGRQIPLGSAVTVLRRRDLDPHDLRISRDHARIIYQGSQFWLEDLGSKNGTYHNGSLVNGRALLQTGDQIGVGNIKLKYEAGIASQGTIPTPNLKEVKRYERA